MRTISNVMVCGYSPYQEVQCNVSAFNEAGDSEIGNSSSVRTDCAGEWNMFIAPVNCVEFLQYVELHLLQPRRLRLI